jgi:lycopene beta-cyclase
VNVIVVGGGPAGRALVRACADAGLSTTLVDPNPDRPWTATYGAWADELPAGTPVLTTATDVRAVALQEHRIDRHYAVLDNLRLHELPESVTVIAGKAVRTEHGPHGSTVALADGTRLAASVVVNAGGAPPRRRCAEQTAFGTVVSVEAAREIVGPGEAVLMDWRQPPHGELRWPTFLYAIPLGGDRVLLEETSLARRPGLPLRELQRRLRSRLAAHGVRPTSAHELVRFPVDVPRPRSVAFGAAAALVHPATGYSVATSLRLAPEVAAAVADALPRGGEAVRAAVRSVVWSPSAKLVHLCRRRGLEALLAFPPERVPEFFDSFFRMPARLQRAYLSERDDVTAVYAAMGALFRDSSWGMRRRLVLPVPSPR